MTCPRCGSESNHYVWRDGFVPGCPACDAPFSDMVSLEAPSATAPDALEPPADTPADDVPAEPKPARGRRSKS